MDEPEMERGNMDDDDVGSQAITRKTIVRALSQEMQLPQPIVKQLVEKLFDVITDSLVVNQRLELRNFGVFEVKKRAPRVGRNPKTKEEIPIGSRYVVTFKPGKAMEQRLQQLMAERHGE
jgi:nucleoid DNA-binding protein